MSCAVNTSKRSVSFSPYVKVKETLHINDFDEDEIDATWYFAEEYHAMRADILSTTKLMAQNAYIDEENRSYRGVETKVPEERKRMLRLRKASIQAVLSEQRRLRLRLQKEKAEDIAKVYKKHTKESVMSAYYTAMVDEQVVRVNNAQASVQESLPQPQSCSMSQLSSPPATTRQFHAITCMARLT